MTRTLTVLFVLALAVGAIAGAISLDHEPAAASLSADGDDKASVTDHNLTSFDGVSIAFTVFRPAGVSATDPVPLVLHSHGWGGSRATEVGGVVEALLEARYGVLSFDARGHGESSGYATIHHKDFEVKDTIAVIDWAYDNLAWAAKEGAVADKDLVLGAVGGSYGGGYQLMAASYDDRLDAIVPQMTWNDLRYSLAPGGVVKSVWVDALYGAGLASVNMHPSIHEWFAVGMATNALPEEANVHLKESSPVPENIEAATLLVQGMPDMLFNWNEAKRNYDGILAGGNPDVALVGYLGGHVLPGVQPTGFMGPPRSGEPCGAYSDLAVDWFDRHLRGLSAVAVPTGVWHATEYGACLKNGAPSGVYTADMGYVPMTSGAGAVLLPTMVVAGTIAGIPTVTGEFRGAMESTFFFSLVMCRNCSVTSYPPYGPGYGSPADARFHVIDDQVAALRIGPSPVPGWTEFELPLNGVATTLGSRDSHLFLRIEGTNEWYGTNAARPPMAAEFQDLALHLPFSGSVCLTGLPGPGGWMNALQCQT